MRIVPEFFPQAAAGGAWDAPSPNVKIASGVVHGAVCLSLPLSALYGRVCVRNGEMCIRGTPAVFPPVSPDTPVSFDTPVRHMIPAPAMPGRQRRMVRAFTERCGFRPGKRCNACTGMKRVVLYLKWWVRYLLRALNPLCPACMGCKSSPSARLCRNAAAVLRVRSAMAQIYSPFARVPCCSPVAVRSLFRPSMPAVTRKGKRPDGLAALSDAFLASDPGGARTLDPMIKSHLLYQLSYGVMLSYRFAGAKVVH